MSIWAKLVLLLVAFLAGGATGIKWQLGVQARADLAAADTRMRDAQRQLKTIDQAATTQVATLANINNQLGYAREKIAALSGRQCLDADTVRMLNTIGGEPVPTSTGQSADSASAAATSAGLTGAFAMSITAKLIAALALLSALFFGEQYIEGLGYSRAVAECAVRIEAQKTAATQMLAEETAKTRAAEKTLQEKINQQEIKDEKNQKTVAALSGRLRVLAGPAGRLRDPNASSTGCGGGGGGTTGAIATADGGGAADPAETGGLLSADLSGLLQRLIREADDINAAYISCRVDTSSVRGILTTE